MTEKTAEKLITAAEFAAMPSDGKKYELVKGVLAEVCRPTYLHGIVVINLIGVLRDYLREHPIGRLTTESGYIIAHDPDSVRGPDVAFLSNARRPEPNAPLPDYIDNAPDLAIEVVSPGNKQSEIDDKVDEYLLAGTRLVWVVYPKSKTIHVFSPDDEPFAVDHFDQLDGGEVLHGFSVAVSQLFEV